MGSRRRQLIKELTYYLWTRLFLQGGRSLDAVKLHIVVIFAKQNRQDRQKINEHFRSLFTSSCRAAAQCIKTSLTKSHFIELRAKRVLRFFQPFLAFEKLFRPFKLCLYSKLCNKIITVKKVYKVF